MRYRKGGPLSELIDKLYVILFVCTGNTCRSPMAEAALRVLLSKERRGQFEVVSAGTSAVVGWPAADHAAEAVKVWDGDLSGHVAQPFTRELAQRADLILAMTSGHVSEILHISPECKEKAYLFKNFPDNSPVGEGVEDPIGQSLNIYNETFLEIGEFLGKHLPEIVKRIDAKRDA
jgi:L-threonylcarbamoyladenylate synthase